jgi:hypothetical protein
MRRTVYLEPPDPLFMGDRCLDAEGPPINRDGQWDPMRRVRAALRAQGRDLRTADFWTPADGRVDYYSLGTTRLLSMMQADAKAFILLEPPNVAGYLYRKLPWLTRTFERVYVYNTHGDAYSLKGVDTSRLRQVRFPQPWRGVRPEWSVPGRQRADKMVVINSNKRPRHNVRDLYGARIWAMAELARHDAVDLYGHGWRRITQGSWMNPKKFFWPHIRNLRTTRSIYRGTVDSKYAALAKYAFSLCYENCVMDGYVTEKIVDCLYAGTIPCYLGAPDIASIVPKAAFIDARDFESTTELWQHAKGLSPAERQEHRDAGKAFLESKAFDAFYDSLASVFKLDAAHA